MIPIALRLAAAAQLGAETLRESGLAPELPLPAHGLLIFTVLAAASFIADEIATALRTVWLAFRRRRRRE